MQTGPTHTGIRIIASIQAGSQYTPHANCKQRKSLNDICLDIDIIRGGYFRNTIYLY